MTTKPNNAERNEMWRRTARAAGVVAVIFSLVVGVLLTTDFMRAGQAKTLLSDSLNKVLTSARAEAPDAGTVALARDMERMARHAYFSSVEFRNAGTWMLILGLLAAISCLHLAARLGRRIEDPRRFPALDQARADREARLALLIGGVGCLLLLPVWALDGVSSAPVAAATPTPVAAVPAKESPAAAPAANPVAPAPAAATPVAAAPAAAPAVASAGAFQWNGFRGPRCGVAPWANAPMAWDGKKGEGVLWKVELGKTLGLSSPVICAGKLYLTVGDEQTPELREVVAYSAKDGKELWRKPVKFMGQGDLPTTSSGTGLGAPTPVCDEAGVYAFFGTGDLVAFSPTGDQLWQVYVGRPDMGYGYAASLALEGSKIFVQFDHNGDDARALAVDAKTGKTLWEKKRTSGSSWCTPAVVPGVDGKLMVVMKGRGTLTAYEPGSGKELWNIDDDVSGDVSPSPACCNGRVVVAMASSRIACYELGAKPVQKWEDREIDLPDTSSPVAADGLVIVPSKGSLTCMDLMTGAKLWAHDFNGAYPSPVICGKNVYAMDGDGVTHIIALERKYREIAACSLGEGETVGATPAFADGRIYIRSEKTLWCIGTK